MLSSPLLDESGTGELPSLTWIFDFERREAWRHTPEQINEEIGPAPTVSEYLQGRGRGRGLSLTQGHGARGRGKGKGWGKKRKIDYIEEQDKN